jgi:hypothetical protein
VGRKYTFLVTIVVMGIATFAITCCRLQTIGWAAPILLVSLRLLRVSRSALNTAVPTWPSMHRTTVAERHSWIRPATLGFFLSLAVIGGARYYMARRTSPNGDGACRSGVVDPAGVLGLHPAGKSRQCSEDQVGRQAPKR